LKVVSEAHEVLSDPEKKKLYDAFGSDWAAAKAAGVQPGQGNPFGGGGVRRGAGGAGGPRVEYRTVSPDEVGDIFGEAGGFGDIFGSIFGGPQRGARAQALDVDMPITVSLAEVQVGTSRAGELPGGRRATSTRRSRSSCRCRWTTAPASGRQSSRSKVPPTCASDFCCHSSSSRAWGRSQSSSEPRGCWRPTSAQASTCGASLSGWCSSIFPRAT